MWASAVKRRFRDFAKKRSHESPEMSSSHTATFVYEAINPETQMRRLILEPALTLDSPEPLKGRVEVISLPSHNAYSALSYVWGDQTALYPLHLDNQILMIGQNLYEALLHIRVGGPKDICYVWIDAVCIDQNNIVEKNHQVAAMCQIYRTASWVVVWLGLGDEETNTAMRFLQQYPQRDKDQPTPFSGLATIFTRPWWSRMWTVQEAFSGAAVMVMCGEKKYCANWHHLMTFTTHAADQDVWRQANVEYPGLDKHLMLQFMYWSTADEDEITLDTLLLATAIRKATDPRDRIYALLGIVNDETFHKIDIDYSKTLETVYQDAMVSLLKSRGDLDWLGYAVGHKWPNIPSWCIDFSQEDWQQRIDSKHKFFPKSKFEKTQGSLSKSLDYYPERGMIRIKGEKIGYIEEVFSPSIDRIRKRLRLNCGTLQSFSREELLKYEEELSRLAVKEMSKFVETAYSALSRRLGHARAEEEITKGALWAIGDADSTQTNQWSLSTDTEEPQRRYEAIQAYAESQDFWPFCSCQWANTLPKEAPTQTIEETLKTLLPIAYQLDDSTLFTTDSGYVGIARYPIKKGDTLVMFYSGRFPAILQGSEDDSYKLASFTWTHDAMNSQYIDEKRPNLSQTDFFLR